MIFTSNRGEIIESTLHVHNQVNQLLLGIKHESFTPAIDKRSSKVHKNQLNKQTIVKNHFYYTLQIFATLKTHWSEGVEEEGNILSVLGVAKKKKSNVLWFFCFVSPAKQREITNIFIFH